jgi:arylsulfatase A-like enzyme
VGVYGNYGRLGPEILSLPQHLKNNGYDTGAFGKLHIPVEWPTHGFNVRRQCDFADVKNHEEENHYYAYLKRLGLAGDYDLGIASDKFPHTTFVSNIPYEHCVEKWTADETLNWLKHDRDSNKPFFAWMTFQRPHPPFSPPREYKDLYSPDDIKLPPRKEGEAENKPREWKEKLSSELFQKSSDEDIRQAVAYYYSLITLIDEQVGRVLHYLEREGILRNTIIVYSSDHGDFAGEHGLVRKNVCIPEAVMRIPFIWHYPGEIEEGAVKDALVESVDFFPTICDLLGINTPDNVQGRSILPILKGEKNEGKQAAFCENQQYKAIRTSDWKLTYCVGRNDGELYDMRSDPWEHNNLFHNEKYSGVKAKLLERLLDFYAQTERPVIPEGTGPPRDEPEGPHGAWIKEWWKAGGRKNQTPLDHLGGPGVPLNS